MEVIGIHSHRVDYSKEVERITMRGKTITIENRIPVFTEEESFAQRRSIEEGLYDIFSKYASIGQNVTAKKACTK